jgi:hypothetical protein
MNCRNPLIRNEGGNKEGMRVSAARVFYRGMSGWYEE